MPILATWLLSALILMHGNLLSLVQGPVSCSFIQKTALPHLHIPMEMAPENKTIGDPCVLVRESDYREHA